MQPSQSARKGGQCRFVAPVLYVISFSASASVCKEGGQLQCVALLIYVISFSAASSACEKGGQCYKTHSTANSFTAIYC
eukprot:8368169-Karenia_brevis.AAC.1